MPSRTRSREFLVIGGVLATVTKPAPNVTRIEVHAKTPDEADRFADGLASMLKLGEPVATDALTPETSIPQAGVVNRAEWRLGKPIADPDAPNGLGVRAPTSDAAEHGDPERPDPDTD